MVVWVLLIWLCDGVCGVLSWVIVCLFCLVYRCVLCLTREVLLVLIGFICCGVVVSYVWCVVLLCYDMICYDWVMGYVLICSAKIISGMFFGVHVWHCLCGVMLLCLCWYCCALWCSVVM